MLEQNQQRLFKDWGIVLSPDFIYDPELFLMATLIPLAYVYQENGGFVGNPVYVDMCSLREFFTNRMEQLELGLDKLIKKGFIRYTQDKELILIGHSVNFMTNKYLFQESKEVSSPSTAESVEKDPEFTPLLKQIDKLYNGYSKFCASIHKPDLAKKVGVVVSTIVSKSYREGKITPNDVLRYIDMYCALHYRFESPMIKAPKYSQKDFGQAKHLTDNIECNTLLKLIPFFISNCETKRWGKPTIGSLLYSKNDILFAFNKQMNNGKNTGGGFI